MLGLGSGGQMKFLGFLDVVQTNEYSKWDGHVRGNSSQF